mmetsp:Transcript_5971/g.13144  ORF Transcript_5971/g.13144 Transcript_5971/m.13144 type:complete len:605 (+) Transcript_5971:88-1902(+)
MVVAIRSIRAGERITDFRKPQRAVPLESPISEALAAADGGSKEAATLVTLRKAFTPEDLPNLKAYGRPGAKRGLKEMLKVSQDALQLCKEMDRGSGKLKNKLADLSALISGSQHREAVLEAVLLLRAALPPSSPEWRFTACSAELEKDATEVNESTVLQPPRVFMGLEKPKFGITAAQRKQLREMWKILDEIVACARDVDDSALQGHALHMLAIFHIVKDEPKATKIALEALAIFRSLKDLSQQREVLSTLCDALVSKGRMSEAAEAAKEMMSKAGPKELKAKAEALLKTAKVAMGKEDYDLAEEMVEEALALYRMNLKDKDGQQLAQQLLLGVRLMNEGVDEGFECARELVQMWQGRDGNRAKEAMAQQVLANVQLFQEIFVSHFLREKGRTYESLKMGQALATIKEALDRYREVADDRHVVASMLSTSAQASALIEDFSDALATAKRIPPIYNELDDKLSEAGAFLQVAEVWFDKIIADVHRDFKAAIEQDGEDKAKEMARDSIPEEEIKAATQAALDARAIYAELKCTEGEEAVAVCIERFNARGLDYHKLIHPPTATYYIMSEDRKTFKVQHEWSFTGEGEDAPHDPITKEILLPPQIEV